MSLDIQQAIKDGGSFDLIRRRLINKGKDLNQKVTKLNELRNLEFGGKDIEVIDAINLMTKNNCIPVDMARLGDLLILGSNTQKGAGRSLDLSDIFTAYNLSAGAAPTQIPLCDTFLTEPSFLSDLNNLLSYNSKASLKQIYQDSDQLFFVFITDAKGLDSQTFTFNTQDIANPAYIGRKSGAKNQESEDINWTKITDKDITGRTTTQAYLSESALISIVDGCIQLNLDDNTENGKNVYSKKLVNDRQRLNDVAISYVDEGDLLLIKIKPLEEQNTHLIFNKTTHAIEETQGISTEYQTLPDGHGIIFRTGFALASGQIKIFQGEDSGLRFHKSLTSPNGEDSLYLFFNPSSGGYTIYHYNMINKNVATPIHASGYTIHSNGELLVFRTSQNNRPEKMHKLQVWSTPFMTSEAYSESISSTVRNSTLSNIGNPALVTGLSEVLSILKLIQDEEVSSNLYEGIINQTSNAIDSHHWLADKEAFNLSIELYEIKKISELVLEEFNKTQQLSSLALNKINALKSENESITKDIKILRGDSPDSYIKKLKDVKLQIGALIESKGLRFVDPKEIDRLSEEMIEQKNHVINLLVSILQKEAAFKEFEGQLSSIDKGISAASKTTELSVHKDKIEELTDGLSLLNDEISDIEVDDTTMITNIVSRLSKMFTQLNAMRATASSKGNNFARTEAESEFSAQINQLDQMIDVSLSRASTPAECDTELAKLTTQFEKLESRFSDFEDYIDVIINKRRDTYSSLETRKTQLNSVLQRRISSIKKSAAVTLDNISQRAGRLTDIKDLHSQFSSDTMVDKIHSYAEQVSALGDVVTSGNLLTSLKNIKEQAARDIRDKGDIFEDDGNLAKLGKHRFNVNKKDIQLNIIESDGRAFASIASTDFLEPINHSGLSSMAKYFSADVPSETTDTYRGEYLAFKLLKAIEEEGVITHEDFESHINPLSPRSESVLENKVAVFIGHLYSEGYIRGVHDADALKILEVVYPLYFSSKNESLAPQGARIEAMTLFSKKDLRHQVEQLKKIKEMAALISSELVFHKAIEKAAEAHQVSKEAVKYLLNSNPYTPEINFQISKEAFLLVDGMKAQGIDLEFFTSDSCDFDLFAIVARQLNPEVTDGFIREARSAVATSVALSEMKANSTFCVNELIGSHATIKNSSINSNIESFTSRCSYVEMVHSPEFNQFIEIRKEVSSELQKTLNLGDFEAKPLANFVRNKLIKDCYMPLIGDSLNSQMGSIDSTTSAQSGGLLLLSPPGYGKTTLMEYIAKILGVVFVKINCPSIGHDVKGIIPEEASSAAAKKELVKLNMALEMGNNVLLYLDDIQHLHTEFLQKFISLCDGTRRIEGSWKGDAKTYDMKGKRFAIAMAGNPYTENGDAFKVPDMLINRMASYNLGDIMTGMDDAFKLSYIENALTSINITAPLASRGQEDVYKLIGMAKDNELNLSELEHNYSPAEASELMNTFKQMLQIQHVVLTVNSEYIRSAAQRFRKEPPFLLQGSYRNMSKMCEKLVPAMNSDDVNSLIHDHYKAESQTLTSGAEENILRFKELTGSMTPAEEIRWISIVDSYGEIDANETNLSFEDRLLTVMNKIAGNLAGNNA